MTNTHCIEIIESEFSALDKNLIYLNHAAVAPWPLRTQTAVNQFAAENVQSGAYHYPQWMQKEQFLRQQIAGLINAPVYDDLALLKNTSEALSVVAHGLSWQAGDNIVTSNEEFPSNRIVWESLKHQGVELRQIDLAGKTPEQALIDATDKNTRLLAISSVQYASGLRLDLEQIGSYCRQHEILFCVDAIQSVGAVATDVQAIKADFMMADGHKWMLGPEGLAFFYCRNEIRERIHLHQYGWHMVEDHLDFSRTDWQAAHTARRFECGSPNMLSIHALSASISLLLDAGMEHIEAQLNDNIQHLINGINSSRNLQLLSRPDPDHLAGIILFRHNKLKHTDLYQQLMKLGVVCAARGAGVRFSPHFYTSKQQISKAIEIADAQT
ncbi:MAG: aminotransferase class V-fold PLP-dependent enzyme [Gammaproteobacteria bacterium]|nr:aminotransferase class V-fold PLP-dependent enzyme [Gammaproteobacteria bacterium]